jgi:hypothetical protein
VFDDDPFAAITEIAGGTTQKKNWNEFSILKLCCGRERVFHKHFRGGEMHTETHKDALRLSKFNVPTKTQWCLM